MRDTTANVGMTPTSKNSMAASAEATKNERPPFRNAEDRVPWEFRELTKEAMAQTRGNYEQIETAANEMMSLLVSTQSMRPRA